MLESLLAEWENQLWNDYCRDGEEWEEWEDETEEN